MTYFYTFEDFCRWYRSQEENKNKTFEQVNKAWEVYCYKRDTHLGLDSLKTDKKLKELEKEDTKK